MPKSKRVIELSSEQVAANREEVIRLLKTIFIHFPEEPKNYNI